MKASFFHLGQLRGSLGESEGYTLAHLIRDNIPEEQGLFSPSYHASTSFDQLPHRPPYHPQAHHSHSTNSFQEHVPNAYQAILPNPSRLSSAKKCPVGPPFPQRLLYIFDPETPVGTIIPRSSAVFFFRPFLLVIVGSPVSGYSAGSLRGQGRY